LIIMTYLDLFTKLIKSDLHIKFF